MDFAQLIAPLTEERFLADCWGRKPVHLPAPAGSSRGGVIGWERLNALLAIRSHWGEDNIKLVLNSRPVAPEHYLDPVGSAGGRRLANPASVETFLAMGASLVADHIQDIAPEVRALTDMLARRFAARASANLYASFQGVQAFASHCDTHEVFAIHCAGEKRWRIYANRAEHPLEVLEGEDAQVRIDAAKGPVAMDVVMRAGDLLYIPRGYFHDAIAVASESLHLTIGVAPHSGRMLFGLLEELAIEDAAFRAYLPDAREAGGAALRERLAGLADRIGALMASPGLVDEVAARQRGLSDPGHRLSLPARPQLTFFARTDRPGAVVRTGQGWVLQAGGTEHRLGELFDAAQYLLGRPAVSLQELRAHYPQHEPAALDALAELARRTGLIAPFQPQRG